MTLEEVIRNLQLDIGRFAAEGDTFTCDVLHSRVAVLEEALQIQTDYPRLGVEGVINY
jgi:hypothetical protein